MKNLWIVGVPAQIRTERFPDTNRERRRYTSLFVETKFHTNTRQHAKV
jgi:hypothetical protein